MPTTDPTDLGRAFEHTGETLIEVHNELARLLVQAAADPWSEAQNRETINKLTGRRKVLLNTWARQALTWKLRGGEVRLTGEAKAQPPAAVAPSTSTTRARDDDGPVVITRTRPTRRSPPSGGDPHGWHAARQEAARNLDRTRFTELLRLLGEPTTPLDSRERVRDELSRLTSGTSNARLEEWATFPKPVQKCLVGMVVARARHLQDEIDTDLIPVAMTGDLDRLFSAMTSYSKREQPGFVFGLQRHHHSMGVTWLADARRWWTDLIDFLPEPSVLSPERALAELRRRIDADLDKDAVLGQIAVALEAGLPPDDPRLVNVTIPLLENLKSEARFKHLRKAIRDTIEKDREALAELTDPDTALPQDWEYEGDVEGRRVAVVGGPLPDEARKRLDEIFRWARVDWVDDHHPRAIERVAERVVDDDIDVVIVLRRFVGADADRILIPMCDKEGVPVADVRDSYGFTAIREALEEALSELEEIDD